MNESERLDHLEAALDLLRRTARGNVLLMEGRRDHEALEELGVGGEHVVLNQGRPLMDVLDRVAEDAQATGRSLLVLTDWDRTGDRLHRTALDLLSGRVPLEEGPRVALVNCLHTRCIEDIPQELDALRRHVLGRP